MQNMTYAELTELCDGLEGIVKMRRAIHGLSAAWLEQLRRARTAQLRMEVYERPRTDAFGLTAT